MIFKDKTPLSKAANNILKRRYFQPGESSWDDVSKRVTDAIMTDEEEEYSEMIYDLISNRYFIPNSPCLVNAGKPNAGLLACYTVDFPDTIEGIYKTKLDFALIARKGGGCGTTLSKLRPEGSKVGGSTHGYAGGPIKFANTISHDMNAISQSGFRDMAILFTMSVYHPDILKFITTKSDEGKLSNANISVVVDDSFMHDVLEHPNKEHRVMFGDDEWVLVKDKTTGEVTRESISNLHSKSPITVYDLFSTIVDHAWKNGEPGLQFYNRINDSPYKYTGEEILTSNPCAEQPLPFYGSCNLASLSVPKFYNKDMKMLDLGKLEVATRLGVRFLDKVIDKTSYPTKEIEEWAMSHRAVGIGIMGFADYLLFRKIAYGSKESLQELGFILKFIRDVAEDESISLGEEKGVPNACKLLPVPRRNITLLTIAPTGTISLLGDVSSGIEPVFSDITLRNDRTGTYTFNNIFAELPYFRCAVSANGAAEVTWEEHLAVLAEAQKWVDSGVSKTVNLPNHVHRDTVAKVFMGAWRLNCKGVTVYRNGSRKEEVLSPKKVIKE